MMIFSLATSLFIKSLISRSLVVASGKSAYVEPRRAVELAAHVVGTHATLSIPQRIVDIELLRLWDVGSTCFTEVVAAHIVREVKGPLAYAGAQPASRFRNSCYSKSSGKSPDMFTICKRSISQ